jgi:hypothetical protein
MIKKKKWTKLNRSLYYLLPHPLLLSGNGIGLNFSLLSFFLHRKKEKERKRKKRKYLDKLFF